MGSIVHEFIDEFGRKRRIFFRRRNATMLELIQNNSSGLVTSWSSIKGLWIFDQTGATSTISDRSGNSHNITLRDTSLNAINASTCTPGVTGLSPYLTISGGAAVWNTPDSNDFTFIEPQPFSLLVMAVVLQTGNIQMLIAKDDLTTGATNREWRLLIVSTDKIYAQLYDDSASGANIGRYYNTAITSTIGSIFTAIMTYSGSGLSSGIKIYVNGTQVDDSNDISGTYVAMENKAALVGSYILGTGGAVTYPFRGRKYVQGIIAEELTAAQVANWDRILRASAGVTV